MYRHYSALFAATCICIALLACIGARVMTSDLPPPITSRNAPQKNAREKRVDWNTADTSDNAHEDRVFTFSAAESATIKGKADKLMARIDSLKSTVTSESAETKSDSLKSTLTSEKLLRRDDSLKSTVTSESAEKLFRRDDSIKGTVSSPSQINKKRKGNDMELDSNKKTKLFESMEDHMMKQKWYNQGPKSLSNMKRKGNDMELNSNKKSKLVGSLEDKLNTLALSRDTSPSNKVRTGNKKRKANTMEADSDKMPRLLNFIQDHDDDTILLMTVGAKTHEDSGLTSKELETYLLEKWDDYGFTLDEVFHTPNDKTFREILKFPMPKVWLTYAVKVKEDPYEVLLEMLTSRYGEAELVRLLMTLKLDGTIDKPLSSQLVKLQFQKWFFERGLNFGGVTRRLGLRKLDPIQFLKDPASHMCFLYADWLGKKPYNAFLSGYKKHVGESGVASILVVAKEGGGDVKLVEKLQYYQFQDWKSSGIDKIAAKKLLGLTDQTAVDGNPLYRAWKSYETYLAKGNENMLK